MAPKPLRKSTRKAAAVLPATQTAAFLLDATLNLVGEENPQLRALLGRKCLQVKTPARG